MAYELTGKLHKVFDTEQKTDTFKVRDFVVETDGEYPQMVKFQCSQDRCGVVDQFSEGDVVKVSFDLRGREWQGKYFTNLNAWRVEGVQQNQANDEHNQAPPEIDYSKQEKPLSESEDFEDDLPF